MSQPERPGSVFIVDGDRLVPTDLARGPWDPRAQHGGPPAGLVARAVERVPTAVPMQVTRLTVELLRPVPLEPLAVEAHAVRDGKRVQLVDAAITAAGEVVVRARALKIRAHDVALPEIPADPAPPGPDEASPVGPPEAARVTDVAFHTAAMEIRAVAGSFDRPGPAIAWFRLRQPLVEGEEPSPLVRVAAAADFGNGISGVLPFDRYSFVNPDLTVHLIRPPDGEWMCLDARTIPASGGAGLAESALFDRAGRVGRSVQSLLLDRT